MVVDNGKKSSWFFGQRIPRGVQSPRRPRASPASDFRTFASQT
jgi:hypothetical protein